MVLGDTLLPDYHLHIAGLNEDELSTLFFPEGQRPLSDLDLHTTREVALAKVLSTLAERDKRRAAEIQERLHVDSTGWNFPVDEVPHLRTVQDAVWQNCRLSLVYRQESGNIMTLLVDPLGLVVKAGIWYLVGATYETMRPFRIARIQQIEVLQETFNRPEGFHLAQYWVEWCTHFLPSYPVTLRISPDAVPRLLQLFGEAFSDRLLRSEPDASGWRTVSLVFETAETTRAHGDASSCFCLPTLSTCRLLRRHSPTSKPFYAGWEHARQKPCKKRLGKLFSLSLCTMPSGGSRIVATSLFCTSKMSKTRKTCKGVGSDAGVFLLLFRGSKLLCWHIPCHLPSPRFYHCNSWSEYQAYDHVQITDSSSRIHYQSPEDPENH